VEREAGSGRNRIGMWYVLNCGVRMMVYGMVLWYYGTVCTARGYLQYQPTNFRTKLDKKDYRNPTGRFSEFGGFRPAIYRTLGFQIRDLRELLPDGRTPSCHSDTRT
jgi:hypothetical protein